MKALAQNATRAARCIDLKFDNTSVPNWKITDITVWYHRIH